jgi:hypothetical protein
MAIVILLIATIMVVKLTEKKSVKTRIRKRNRMVWTW